MVWSEEVGIPRCAWCVACDGKTSYQVTEGSEVSRNSEPDSEIDHAWTLWLQTVPGASAASSREPAELLISCASTAATCNEEPVLHLRGERGTPTYSSKSTEFSWNWHIPSALEVSSPLVRHSVKFPQSPPPREKTKLGDEILDFAVMLREEETRHRQRAGRQSFRLLRLWRFWRYFMVCLLVCGLDGAVVVLCFSTVGWGEATVSLLQDRSMMAMALASLGVAILVLLYVLDFFSPPHLPGKHLVLSANWSRTGRVVLALGGFCFVLAGFCASEFYPIIPLLITVHAGPPTLVLVRHLVRPPWVKLTDSGLDALTVREMVLLLRRVDQNEDDQLAFYLAAGCAFAFTGVLELLSFVLARSNEPKLTEDSEVFYVLWTAPLVAVCTHVVYAIFMGLRVGLHATYRGTDTFKHELNATVQKAIASLEARGRQVEPSRSQLDEEWRAESARQHARFMSRLKIVMRLVGCGIVFLFAAFFLTYSVCFNDSHVAAMVRDTLALFCIVFVIFVWRSFKRLWREMEQWMASSPVWRVAKRSAGSDWCKAVAACAVGPAIPFYLTLSLLNQTVRRCRGLDEPYSLLKLDDCSPQAWRFLSCWRARGISNQPRFLTKRVDQQMRSVIAWDVTSVVKKANLVAAMMALYPIILLLMDVVLLYMIEVLDALAFGAVVTAYYGIGLVCFMLPPVPGPPIYVFGGLVVCSSCPWGFWPGTVICIFLAWTLKHAACAMQQKFGEFLGSRNWVRQLCKVHSPEIRAVENVLRQPGMSLGKVAILCGGPDWPTSVGAGILRLSLLEMELGTMPIVFFVVPSVLTGSFYLRKDEDDIWMNAAGVMLSVAVVVTAILWIGAAWSIQVTLDTCERELLTPRLADLMLHWFDHRAAKLGSARRVGWCEVPWTMRALLLVPTCLTAAVSHLFFWFYDRCFTAVELGGGSSDVTLLGTDDAVFLVPGLIGMTTVGVNIVCMCIFSMWSRRHTQSKFRLAMTQLDAEEIKWKIQWQIDTIEKINLLAEGCQTAEPDHVRSNSDPDDCPQDGTGYVGGWHEDLRHGDGRQTWSDGAVFTGQWHGGVAEGLGNLIDAEGNSFSGEWKSSVAEGLGSYVHESLDLMYAGQWKGDRRHGEGVERIAGVCKYFGQFVSDKRHGFGMLEWENGTWYTGTWKDDFIHGYGKCCSVDGEYHGEWKEARMDGMGLYRWPDGRQFRGQYVDNEKHGIGVFSWQDGRRFEGHWIRGLLCGFRSPGDRWVRCHQRQPLLEQVEHAILAEQAARALQDGRSRLPGIQHVTVAQVPANSPCKRALKTFCCDGT